MKTANKIQSLNESLSVGSGFEEMLLDLGRAFYKLHFQVLLLIEASNKMLVALMSAAKSSQSPLKDMSIEIANMKLALSQALEENNETELRILTTSPSPQPQSSGAQEEFVRIAELLKSARWSSALSAVRLHRAQWPGDPVHDDDDVTTAVNMFCKHIGQHGSGKLLSL